MLSERLARVDEWQDEEAWLCDSVWLALACHRRMVLAPLLVRLRIDQRPYEALGNVLAARVINTPQRLADVLSRDGQAIPAYGVLADGEPRRRTLELLASAAHLAELRRAVAAGLAASRQSSSPPGELTQAQ